MTAPVAVELLGVVVRTRPERSHGVAATLAHWPGVEVHALGEAGQLVVTIEGASRKAVLAQVDAIEQHPGVIAVALAYSHSEPPAASPEEQP